jgi:hypothetical protein
MANDNPEKNYPRMSKDARDYFGAEQFAADPRYGNTETVETTTGVTPDKKQKSKIGGRVLGTVVITSVVLGVGGLGVYFVDVASSNRGLVYTDGGLEKTVDPTVEKVTMEIEPFTLSTSNISVPGNNAKMVTNMLGLEVPKGRVIRDVDTELMVDFYPGTVEINFDPDTDALVYQIPNGSIKARVEIPDGGGRTLQTPDNILSLGIQNIANLSDSIDGTLADLNIDAARVPFISDLADGKTNIQTALENYVDFSAKANVNANCMDNISKIPGFEEEIKKEIAETVRIRLFDDDVNSEELLKKDNVKEIVANATVELEGDFKAEPDQAIIDEAKSYKEAGIFILEDNAKSVICKVPEDMKLTIVGKGVSN